MLNVQIFPPFFVKYELIICYLRFFYVTLHYNIIK